MSDYKIVSQIAEMIPHINQQDYFRDIIDHMLEGCQIISHEWRYLYVNDAVTRQAGKMKHELLGKRMMDVYPGIDNTPMFHLLRQCMAKRTSARMLNEFVFPDGSRGWFDLSIQPVPDGLFIMSLDITGHKLAEELISVQLKRLATLRAIDVAILNNTDFRMALKTILEETKIRLEADIAHIELFNPNTFMLEIALAIGNRCHDIEHLPICMGDKSKAEIISQHRTISIPNLIETAMHDPLKSILDKEDAKAMYSTPLIAKGILIGVLNVIMRSPFTASPDWIEFFETLANHTAMAIDGGRSFESLQIANHDLKMAYDTTIEGWSRALDLRDHETEGHSRRVTEMVLKLAQMAGINEEEQVHIRHGALLHDIGKMGIPDAILLKADRLTPEECLIMQKHPDYAYELLSPIEYLNPALDIPYCHHEKWDGSGYPRKLKEEQIPLASRLFTVVDVWDALGSDRPYRQAWPEESVLEYITKMSGIHFDPQAVVLFLKLITGK